MVWQGPTAVGLRTLMVVAFALLFLLSAAPRVSTAQGDPQPHLHEQQKYTEAGNTNPPPVDAEIGSEAHRESAPVPLPTEEESRADADANAEGPSPPPETTTSFSSGEQAPPPSDDGTAETDAVEEAYNAAWGMVFAPDLSAFQPEAAFNLLKNNGAQKGHPPSQFLLGFMYANGLGIESSVPKSLLYYTMAALGGDVYAHSALGYRYTVGLGVTKNCETAIGHYRRVAEFVDANVMAAGGELVERQRIDLITKEEAVSEADIIQYYIYNADIDDMGSQLMAGRLYYMGKGVEQNYGEAMRYFNRAAQLGNADAKAMIGEMYMNGLGVEPDNKTAVDYFEAAAKGKSAAGLSLYATMLLHGQDVQKDEKQAYKYFLHAAQMGYSDAQYNLALLYYNGIATEQDHSSAHKFFKQAAQQGHVRAIYHLGLMQALGQGAPYNCESANALFKNVAERADWVRQIMDAFDEYEDGNYFSALMTYMLIGELGIEVAQHNAAVIMEKGLVDDFAFDANDTDRRALHLWRQSAQQGQLHARVKVGDYIYYGKGVMKDAAAAANEYRLAADQNDAQAMFNLGAMHQFGDGLDRDLHLAKRYYDMAYDTSDDARLPASIALLSLDVLFFLEEFQAEYIPYLKQKVREIDLDSLFTPGSATSLSQFAEDNQTVIVISCVVACVLTYLAKNLHTQRYRRRMERQINRQIRQEIAAEKKERHERYKQEEEQHRQRAAQEGAIGSEEVEAGDGPSEGASSQQNSSGQEANSS